jgi:hypothetical protein
LGSVITLQQSLRPAFSDCIIITIPLLPLSAHGWEILCSPAARLFFCFPLFDFVDYSTTPLPRRGPSSLLPPAHKRLFRESSQQLRRFDRLRFETKPPGFCCTLRQGNRGSAFWPPYMRSWPAQEQPVGPIFSCSRLTSGDSLLGLTPFSCTPQRERRERGTHSHHDGPSTVIWRNGRRTAEYLYRVQVVRQAPGFEWLRQILVHQRRNEHSRRPRWRRRSTTTASSSALPAQWRADTRVQGALPPSAWVLQPKRTLGRSSELPKQEAKRGHHQARPR